MTLLRAPAVGRGSLIAGLTPVPYWDVHGGAFPWLVELEKNYQVIRDELMEGLKNPELERVGNSVWVVGEGGK